MPWTIVYVALAVAGLAVLAVLGVRVLKEVRRLSNAVARSSGDIARATQELDRAMRPLAAPTSTVTAGTDRR